MFIEFTEVFFELPTSYGGIKGNWDVLGNWFELHTCSGETGVWELGNWETGVVVLATSWAPKCWS